MAEAAPQTHAGTEAKTGGFPPFDTTTYPSQLFWLAITFAVLFAVLWRIALPRIGGAIAARKGQIDGDLATAQAHRKAAEDASAAYDAALAAARSRAHALAEENRKRIAGEVERAKAAADADAQAAMAKAEAAIATTREAARTHVAGAARDAAIDIVARLIGDTVSADEAAAAVRAATGS
jgi:F-type H+-transporting ATPase subunit b